MDPEEHQEAAFNMFKGLEQEIRGPDDMYGKQQCEWPNEGDEKPTFDWIKEENHESDSEQGLDQVKIENGFSTVPEFNVLCNDRESDCEQALDQVHNHSHDMEGADLVLVFSHSTEDEQETGCREALQWVKKEDEEMHSERVFDEVKEEQSQEESPVPEERTVLRHFQEMHDERLIIEIKPERAVLEQEDRCQDRGEPGKSLSAGGTVETEQRPFTCTVCGKGFMESQSLKRHLKIHSEHRPFTCDICRKGFTEKYELNRHMRIHSGEKPFACGFCQKGFPRQGDLTSHMHVHSEKRQKKKYKFCHVCDEKFSAKNSLTLHVRKIHGIDRQYDCKVCPRGFPSKNGLTGHMQTHVNRPHICKECGKRFMKESSLTVHMRIHGGDICYTCNVCEEEFMYQNGLTAHMRTHNRDVHKCNVCGKGFTKESGLKKHMKTHSKERPYICDVCDKGFTEKDTLARHIRIHSGERPFRCNICGKGYIRMVHLVSHLNTHSGEKPYKCSVCGKAFSWASGLDKHKRMHSGEKPYTCHVCGDGFTYKSLLSTHLKIHRRDRPCNCTICGRGFEKKCSLISHIERHAFSTVPDFNVLCNDRESDCEQALNQVDNHGHDMEGADLVYDHSKEDKQATGFKEALQWVKKEDEETHCERVFDEVKEEQSQEESPVPEERTVLRHFQEIHDKRLIIEIKPERAVLEQEDYCQDRGEPGKSLSAGGTVETEQRPFTCTVCGKGFMESQSMKRYLEILSEQRPFICDICRKEYIEKAKPSENVAKASVVRSYNRTGIQVSKRTNKVMRKRKYKRKYREFKKMQKEEKLYHVYC